MQIFGDYRQKFLPFSIFIHLGSCCCPTGLEGELQGSVERSYSHDVPGLCFAEPIDLDHWDNRNLTSTRTFICLLPSTAFGDLLNTSEKSCASLISWCALFLFALRWIWKVSFIPCSHRARRGYPQSQAGSRAAAHMAAGSASLPASCGLERMQIPRWWGPGCRAQGVWCHLG